MIYTVGNVPDSSKYVRTNFKHFLDWFNSVDSYQLDLETNITRTRLGRTIRTIQFGEVRAEFNNLGIRWFIVWNDLTPSELLELRWCLEDSKKKKYIHNASFEYETLLNYGIVLENVYDTMLAEKIKWAGYFTAEEDENENTFFSLAGTLFRYWQIILDKSYQTAFVDGIPLTEGHVLYGCDDVTHLDLLARTQYKFLKEEGLINVLNLENEAVLAFGDITWYGMKMDQEKWLSNIEDAEPLIREFKLKMDNWLLTDPIFNKYARENEVITTEDTVAFNKNSPVHKLNLIKRLFPDITGATQPIIKKYSKDNISSDAQDILGDLVNGDWSSSYLELLKTDREWLIAENYLIPEGTIRINWNSTAQVLPMFQKADKNLKDLSEKSRNNFAHAVVPDFENYKRALKLMSSFGQKFLDEFVDLDGCVRTSINQIVSTGRVSSSRPNMQQIPSYEAVGNKYRNAFIPTRKGRVFVDSDYSSQELCIIAFISKDPVWLKALTEGKDLHSVCAELVYGKTWLNAAEADCAYYKLDSNGLPSKNKCNCKKHKVLRFNCKTINFGLAYGMSKFKLAGTLHITVPEAESLIDLYFTTFPAIGQTLTNLGGYGVQTGLIKTLAPFNRKRWFPEWAKVKDHIEYHIKGIQYNGLLGEIERASKNQPIQGAAADMMKYALVLIRRYINDNKLRERVNLSMQVHDQATTECDEDYAEIWMPKLTELMEKAARLIIPSGILKADTNISAVWTK